MAKNRNEVEKELVNAKSVDEVKTILSENNVTISDEEAKELFKKIEEKEDIFTKEVSVDELEAVSGGADRDYRKQGCAATVEYNSFCWSNDRCTFVSVTYDNGPTRKCPVCGAGMYVLSEEMTGDQILKCPKCGKHETNICW